MCYKTPSSPHDLGNEEVEVRVLRGKLDLPACLALLGKQAGIEKGVTRHLDLRWMRQPHHHADLRLQFRGPAGHDVPLHRSGGLFGEVVYASQRLLNGLLLYVYAAGTRQ